MSSVRVAARDLERFVAATLRAAGATEGDAACVARALVAADVAGHASHGILRAPAYLEGIDQGSIDLRARPELTGEDGATARVDGHDGFGQVAGRFAMEIAIGKAREHGVSGVALVRTTHGRPAGRLRGAGRRGRDGGTGLLHGHQRQRAGRPFGSVQPVFGTNPFAAAIPSADAHRPLRLRDQRGCGRQAADRGQQGEDRSPEGWLLSPDGRPTTDPSDHYAGGPLLAFGGHKGFGPCHRQPDSARRYRRRQGHPALPAWWRATGVLFIVIDIRA